MPDPANDPHAGQPVVREGVAVEDARLVLLLLHGRGASARSMLTLADKLALDEAALVAPQAFRHTWYPYSFLAPLSQNEPMLSSALLTVDRQVSRFVEQGVALNQIAIVGFSQGACLASEYAARHPRRYGAVIAFSGGLIGSADAEGAASGNNASGDKEFEYDGDLEGTPVFFGCSDVDAHIPVERVHLSSDVFQSLNAVVTTRIYEGMGHTINDDELQCARGILQSI